MYSWRTIFRCKTLWMDAIFTNIITEWNGGGVTEKFYCWLRLTAAWSEQVLNLHWRYENESDTFYNFEEGTNNLLKGKRFPSVICLEILLQMHSWIRNTESEVSRVADLLGGILGKLPVDTSSYKLMDKASICVSLKKQNDVLLQHFTFYTKSTIYTNKVQPVEPIEFYFVLHNVRTIRGKSITRF